MRAAAAPSSTLCAALLVAVLGRPRCSVNGRMPLWTLATPPLLRCVAVLAVIMRSRLHCKFLPGGFLERDEVLFVARMPLGYDTINRRLLPY